MSEYVRKEGSRESVDITAGQGTSMQVLVSSDEAPNFALRKFTMKPHGGMPMHTNAVEHEQYIVKGSAVVVIGEETFEVSAGDSVYIPSMVPIPTKPEKRVLSFFALYQTSKTRLNLFETL